MQFNNYACIGDIHGRYDLLELLLDKLDTPEHAHYGIVFMGDMVDRGPDSFKVVERVRLLVESKLAIALMGNHEDMMLDYIKKGPVVDGRNYAGQEHIWLMNGGIATKRSYGFVDEFFQNVETSGHRAFLASLPYYHETDKIWLSHAPIPKIEMRMSKPEFRTSKYHLLWSFPSDSGPEGQVEHNHGKLAVCGHVYGEWPPINREPRVYPHYIYADTGSGCHKDGNLSAVLIDDGKFTKFIQASPQEIS